MEKKVYVVVAQPRGEGKSFARRMIEEMREAEKNGTYKQWRDKFFGVEESGSAQNDLDERQKAILDHYGYEVPDPAEIAFEHDAIAMSQQESCVEEGYQDISQKPTEACCCGHQNDSRPISDRERCLNDAARCILHDRDKQYGSPEDNFSIIANMWNAYLGNKMLSKLKPHDVAVMMTMLKFARIATGEPKYDNWVDAVGYCACGCEVQGREVMAE